MLERDYLMRMMKSFIDAIGKIAKLKQEKQFEQALSLVDEQLSLLLRLRAKHVNSLSEDDLLKLMTTYGKLEGEKVLMVAALTEDQADVHELMGDETEAYRLRLRALRLYLHAAPTLADGEVVDYAARIEAMLTRLKQYRLPAKTCLLMMQYEEAAGRYAQAEDWLYRFAEAVGGGSERNAGAASGVSGVNVGGGREDGLGGVSDKGGKEGGRELSGGDVEDRGNVASAVHGGQKNGSGGAGEGKGLGGAQTRFSEADSVLLVGEQFYERLSGLGDDRLEQGNFSREEVGTGLEDWRALWIG
jgi:hypothetical protein